MYSKVEVTGSFLVAGIYLLHVYMHMLVDVKVYTCVFACDTSSDQLSKQI